MRIPARVARVIDADLQRLPLLLKETKRLRKANAAFAVGVSRCENEVAAKDTVIVTLERRLGNEHKLTTNAEANWQKYQAKSTARGWTIGGLLAVLAALGLNALH